MWRRVVEGQSRQEHHGQEQRADGANPQGATYVLPLRGLPEVSALSVEVHAGGVPVARLERSRFVPDMDLPVPARAGGIRRRERRGEGRGAAGRRRRSDRRRWGTQVRLIGGRVVNGQVEIGTVSRRGLP